MSGADAPGPRLTHWEGVPIATWQRTWRVPALEMYDRLPSTNDRARTLADAGAPRFTTVLAEEQTAGRGRSGRTWSAPHGAGLWLSTVGRPLGAPGSALTPILVGLAVVRAVRTVAPDLDPKLKWPNDVMVRGRKACGILCEAVGGGTDVVAGLGINVRQRREDFPVPLRASAISLDEAAGRAVSRAALATALMHELTALLDRDDAGLGALAAEVARADALAGRAVSVSGPAGTDLSGIARGLDDDGALVVVDASGRAHRVHAGTVRPAASSRSRSNEDSQAANGG